MKLFLRELSENIMNKLYLKYVFFVFLGVSNVACSESDSYVVDPAPVLTAVVNDSASVPDISYTVENEYSKIDSDDSPVGYWEVDLSYPVLSNPSNTSEIIRINQAIKDLVNKYTCADGGDKTFNGTMIRVDENHVSLQYESMWMCATMPHPDTDSGNILFDTLTGLIVN